MARSRSECAQICDRDRLYNWKAYVYQTGEKCNRTKLGRCLTACHVHPVELLNVIANTGIDGFLRMCVSDCFWDTEC